MFVTVPTIVGFQEMQLHQPLTTASRFDPLLHPRLRRAGRPARAVRRR